MIKIEQLTFTRFIAAILIVIFHYGKESPLFNNSYIDFIIVQANIGVSYFFLLSGFVMMIAYANKEKIEWFKYFKNRFARIYPIYFGALAIILGVQVLTNSINLEGFLLNVFMIQSWLPEKAQIFNPVAWSLSVEFFFYLSFPFIYNFYIKKFDLKKVLIGIILFWISSQIIFHVLLIFEPFNNIIINQRTFYMYNPFLHFNEFLVGVGTGYLYVEKMLNKSRNTDFYLIGVVLLLILVLKYNYIFNLHNGALALIFSAFLILLSLNNGIITRLFKIKALVFLGEISYGIYILQFAVFSLISSVTVTKYLKITDYTLIFFFRLIFLIILSAFAYKYFETPLRNRIRKL